MKNIQTYSTFDQYKNPIQKLFTIVDVATLPIVIDLLIFDGYVNFKIHVFRQIFFFFFFCT